jgi:hypothetical protein
MIWGKTQQERKIAAVAKLQKETSGYYRFAWHPVILSDGRWVWLERVFWRLEYIDRLGSRILSGFEWKRSIENEY